jgi:hypothetical protein
MAGVALHYAIEQWELLGRPGDAVAGISAFVHNKYQDELSAAIVAWPDQTGWLKPLRWSIETTIKHYLDKALAAAEAYRTEALSGQWTIWELPDSSPALEVPFQITFDGVTVIGAVDAVLEWPNGELTVRDYKSGTKVPVPLQLGLYKLALSDIFGVDIRRGDYWAGFKNKDTKRTEYRSAGMQDLSRYTREYLSAQYQALDRGVSEGVFLPSPSDCCTICGVRQFCREMGNRSAEYWKGENG